MRDIEISLEDGTTNNFLSFNLPPTLQAYKMAEPSSSGPSPAARAAQRVGPGSGSRRGRRQPPQWARTVRPGGSASTARGRAGGARGEGVWWTRGGRVWTRLGEGAPVR